MPSTTLQNSHESSYLSAVSAIPSSTSIAVTETGIGLLHPGNTALVPNRSPTTAKVRRGLTSSDCLVTNPAETVLVSKRRNVYISEGLRFRWGSKNVVIGNEFGKILISLFLDILKHSIVT